MISFVCFQLAIAIHVAREYYDIRGAFHSQKISYTFGKNPFVLKENPSKIRVNLFVQKKSRTLFLMSEVPLDDISACFLQIRLPRYPGGVYDLRMDGGLPPGFQKGTLF